MKSSLEFWKRNIYDIQLIIPSEKIARQIRPNQQLRIKGKLISWQTGHHHTPVLLEVMTLLS